LGTVEVRVRLSGDQVTEVARGIAQDFGSSVDVTSVVAGDGGSDHVELLLTVSGCHPEPCMVVVNIPRESSELDAELVATIQAALAAHIQPRP
jgi:hypothetical protein